MYDKIEEIRVKEDHREAEEKRWSAAGWDGVSPVTRVEFQVRGVALKELGLRDPFAALEVELDDAGRITGHRVAYRADGVTPQTLADRLDWLWRLCLSWVRLVEPERTRSGKLRPLSRLRDDERWALLRTVSFSDAPKSPLRRFRSRGAASSAQALGVTLSRRRRMASSKRGASRARRTTTMIPREFCESG